MNPKPVICLMGPTASGKTEIALQLADKLPLDIISVDSALVYRGMDIGTAKPSAEQLLRTPHRLVDIREPEETYSAGEFVRDASAAIVEIHDAGRVPLLVGGTMMYFRALTEGMAVLPEADALIREEIDLEAEKFGWQAMHDRLVSIDPEAARRINANDSQRLQRALEVYYVSGKTLSEWQSEGSGSDDRFSFVKVALVADSRPELHKRIASRLQAMLAAGFVAEVKKLKERPELTRDHASMRAVGYRQIWTHLVGEDSLQEAESKALAATRQLCKRQLTWLRSEHNLHSFEPLAEETVTSIHSLLRSHLSD